jgi:hypothetical protein
MIKINLTKKEVKMQWAIGGWTCARGAALKISVCVYFEIQDMF